MAGEEGLLVSVTGLGEFVSVVGYLEFLIGSQFWAGEDHSAESPFGVPAGGWTCVKPLKNLLFLSVSLLDPKHITFYCLAFGSASFIPLFRFVIPS